MASVISAMSSPVRSPIGKFFTPEQLSVLITRMDAKPGDLLLFVSDTAAVVSAVLDALRREMADRLELTDPNKIAFCWVIDFPLFEWNEDEQRWDPSHHLFTSPMAEDVPLLDTDPGKARGQQYDLACNGYEIAGGRGIVHLDRRLSRDEVRPWAHPPKDTHRDVGPTLDPDAPAPQRELAGPESVGAHL